MALPRAHELRRPIDNGDEFGIVNRLPMLLLPSSAGLCEGSSDGRGTGEAGALDDVAGAGLVRPQGPEEGL